MDDNERFDIENVRYEDDGTPIIPRINVTIPKRFRMQFLQDMSDQFRTMPGEQLMAIIIEHFKSRETKKVLAAKGLPEEERRRIPFYGPKQIPKVETDSEQKMGA